MLAFSEFARLAQQGNYVPVTLTLTADLETPVSILSRLKDDENVFLLESVEAGERFGRNSFIGLNPRARCSARLPARENAAPLPLTMNGFPKSSSPTRRSAPNT